MMDKKQRAINWFIRVYIECAMHPVLIHNRVVTDDDVDCFMIVEKRIREVCREFAGRDYCPMNIFKRVNGEVLFDALSIWGWMRNNDDVIRRIREFEPVARHHEKLMEYTEFVNTAERQGISLELAKEFQSEANRKYKQLLLIQKNVFKEYSYSYV